MSYQGTATNKTSWRVRSNSGWFLRLPVPAAELIVSVAPYCTENASMLEENYTHYFDRVAQTGRWRDYRCRNRFKSRHVTELLYDEPFFRDCPERAFIWGTGCRSPGCWVRSRFCCWRSATVCDQVLRCSNWRRNNAQGLTNTLQGTINTIRHMVASGLAISVLPATALTENDHMPFSIICWGSQPPPDWSYWRTAAICPSGSALSAMKRGDYSRSFTGVSFIRD